MPQVTQMTVGPGSPGRKTQALRNDRAAIEGSGLFYPDNIACTPKFFRRFLEASGATEPDIGHEEAHRRIGRTCFYEEEIAALQDAFMSFPWMLREAIMVRSDDWASGVGLWHTTIAITHPGEAMAGAHIAEKIKRVLASDFSEDAQRFRRIKGITENTGVLLMPVFGEFARKRIAPVFSINYIGDNDRGLYSVGFGINGVHCRSAYFSYGTSLDFERILDHLEHMSRLYDGVAVRLGIGTVEKVDMHEVMARAQRTYRRMPEIFENLNRMLRGMVEAAGARYLEIVHESTGRPVFIVTQSSPCTMGTVTRPHIGSRTITMETAYALGTGIATGNRIRVAGTIPPADQERFNQEHANYILIIKVGLLNEFRENWGLKHYSSAAGIAFVVDEIVRTVASHLGGIFRELGILVIVGSDISDVLARIIERESVLHTTGIIYSNEFAGEGFLSIE